MLNLNECEKILQYIEKGELNTLKEYLEAEKSKLIEKREISTSKSRIKAMDDFRRQANCFSDEGRTILLNNHSIYVLKSSSLIEEYNEWAKERCQKRYGYRHQPIEIHSECIDSIKDILGRFGNFQYKEIGKMEPLTISGHNTGIQPKENEQISALRINSIDDQISYCFSKQAIGFAKVFLGKEVSYSVANFIETKGEESFVRTGMVHVSSDKGYGYILGLVKK